MNVWEFSVPPCILCILLLFCLLYLSLLFSLLFFPFLSFFFFFWTELSWKLIKNVYLNRGPNKLMLQCPSLLHQMYMLFINWMYFICDNKLCWTCWIKIKVKVKVKACCYPISWEESFARSRWGGGGFSKQRGLLSSIGIPILKIRRSHNHLIFNMGMPLPGKNGLYIEMGPRYIGFNKSYPQNTTYRNIPYIYPTVNTAR